MLNKSKEVTPSELSHWEDLVVWENARYTEILKAYVADVFPTETVEHTYYSFGEGDIYIVKFKNAHTIRVLGKIMRLALTSDRPLSELMGNDIPFVM